MPKRTTEAVNVKNWVTAVRTEQQVKIVNFLLWAQVARWRHGGRSCRIADPQFAQFFEASEEAIDFRPGNSSPREHRQLAIGRRGLA
jgi:hypothetical protein